MTVSLKLGALAPRRPFGVADLGAYALGRLPAPPGAVQAPEVADWGMLGNDTYGDCTMAGAAHALMAWNAEVSERDRLPDTATVEQQYFALTGGADTGCVEADVLALWHRRGLFGGPRIAGYAPVDHRSLLDLHQAVAFYGAAYLGVALPRSAQEQFAAGEPWTYQGDQPVGGHCIVAVGYHPGALLCVTWGQVVEVTYPWAAAYLTEAWAVIAHQFVEAGQGPALDLAQLNADLPSLAGDDEAGV